MNPTQLFPAIDKLNGDSQETFMKDMGVNYLRRLKKPQQLCYTIATNFNLLSKYFIMKAAMHCVSVCERESVKLAKFFALVISHSPHYVSQHLPF